MENEYMYVGGGVLLLITGLFLGIQTVKFFSQELIFKLENALDSQLKLNKNYLDISIEEMISIISDKVDFIKQTNKILKKTKVDLAKNSQKIEYLNQICDKREELESEIVKLKKIIQRLEKKR
jgi:uncharacterized membrane-anchored protein YhcB (DUF1043 family)